MFTRLQVTRETVTYLLDIFKQDFPAIQAAAENVQVSSAAFATDIVAFLQVGIDLAAEVQEALSGHKARGLVSDHAAAVIDRLQADNKP